MITQDNFIKLIDTKKKFSLLMKKNNNEIENNTKMENLQVKGVEQINYVMILFHTQK